MLQQAMLEQLFEQTAQDQYTRELTLTCLVDLMLDVACGIQLSALRAFNARPPACPCRASLCMPSCGAWSRPSVPR